MGDADSWLPGVRRLDADALGAVYDALSPDLFRFAYRLLGDSHIAEDVVAETFSRLLTAIRHGGGPEVYLRAYLYRVAHNLAMDHHRSAAPIPLDESDFRLERLLGLALQTAAQVGDPELTQLLRRLQLRLESNLTTMEQLRGMDPNGAALRAAQRALIRTHAEVKGALEDPSAFRTRYGAGRPDDAPVQPEVTPGEPPASTPGAGGQGQGPQGPNQDAGQGAGPQGGIGPGDGTLPCTTRVDGTLCPTCTPNLWLTPGPHGRGQGTGGD